MIRITVLVLIIASCGRAYACLNDQSEFFKGKNDHYRPKDYKSFLYEDKEGNVPYGHVFNIRRFESSIKTLDSLFSITRNYNYLSDKGVLLILPLNC